MHAGQAQDTLRSAAASRLVRLVIAETDAQNGANGESAAEKCNRRERFTIEKGAEDQTADRLKQTAKRSSGRADTLYTGCKAEARAAGHAAAENHGEQAPQRPCTECHSDEKQQKANGTCA